MNIAQAICYYIKVHGIKQSFVAEKCGWSKQKISSIVCGKKTIAAEELAAICEAVQVPYDFFYMAENQIQYNLQKEAPHEQDESSHLPA